jgi:site-specific recombinase XerD/ribosomal protein L40E
MIIDLYQGEKRLKQVLENLNDISAKNRKELKAFVKSCLANGTGTLKTVKYVQMLKAILKMLGRDFDKANKKDIEKIAAEIRTSDWSAWTKHDYLIAIKKFFKWLGKENEVGWLKTSMKKKDLKLPTQLLTVEEIKKLIQSARGTRNKALISVLYESALRPSEVMTLMIDNIKFKDNEGEIVLAQSKTEVRPIPLFFSVPILKRWLEEHKNKDNPDAPLWCEEKSTMRKAKRGKSRFLKGTIQSHTKRGYITPAAANKMIKETALRAGIKKRIYLQLFRASRLTELTKKGVTEAVLKKLAGWSESSTSPQHYIRLAGVDVTNALKKAQGIPTEEEKKEKEKSPLEPKECLRCSELNEPTADFCMKCGTPLDINRIIEGEDKRKRDHKILNRALERRVPLTKENIKEIIKELIAEKEIAIK